MAAENKVNGTQNGSGTATLTAPGTTNGSNGTPEKATWRNKVGLAEMLKGGVIMDVVNVEQARHRRRSGRVRGHGAGARALRYSQRWRRRAHERPAE